MKKILVLMSVVVAFMAINLSTVRAETSTQSKESFLGAVTIVEADSNMYTSTKADGDFKVLKKGTIVKIIHINNPERYESWVLVETSNGHGWIYGSTEIKGSRNNGMMLSNGKTVKK